jgi:hypothetical protein
MKPIGTILRYRDDSGEDILMIIGYCRRGGHLTCSVKPNATDYLVYYINEGRRTTRKAVIMIGSVMQQNWEVICEG